MFSIIVYFNVSYNSNSMCNLLSTFLDYGIACLAACMLLLSLIFGAVIPTCIYILLCFCSTNRDVNSVIAVL